MTERTAWVGTSWELNKLRNEVLHFAEALAQSSAANTLAVNRRGRSRTPMATIQTEGLLYNVPRSCDSCDWESREKQ